MNEVSTLEASVETPVTRAVLVEPLTEGRKIGEAQRKAKTVDRLKDWQYLERSLHRLIAGWGRHFTEWNDIATCHRHVWEQSECVRRLRDRLGQFPGAAQHIEAPVSARMEKLVNTVLLAPSFQDAVDGIYGILMPALTRSYQFYGASAHPVHDAPTIATLHEIIGMKEGMRLWRQEFRRRNPHTTDSEDSQAIRRELKNCHDLLEAVEIENNEVAAPLGVNTNFRLPESPGRPAGSVPTYEIKPYLSRDFSTNIEARRLFWAYAYMLEMNLAIDQLRWIYDGHYMPWEFLQDISRHLWDESRHGDSGYSRLLDFGIELGNIGFPAYVPPNLERPLEQPTDAPILAQGKAESLTPQELYEAVFFIGMIAETGHFTVKRQAYDDFVAGGDLESAKMMLFDIIDETTHVQYAHKWLPILAEKAGLDNSDYKERATKLRQESQETHMRNIEEWSKRPEDLNNPHYAKYVELMQIMRERQPLSNVDTCPPRDPLPM